MNMYIYIYIYIYTSLSLSLSHPGGLLLQGEGLAQGVLRARVLRPSRRAGHAFYYYYYL